MGLQAALLPETTVLFDAWGQQQTWSVGGPTALEDKTEPSLIQLTVTLSVLSVNPYKFLATSTMRVYLL